MFNIVAGIDQANWILIVSNFALLLIFYLSRFKQQSKVSMFFFNLTVYTLLTAAFLINDGLDGPLPYMFFVSLALLFVINPAQKALKHFFLHALLLVTLFLFNYFFPESIVHNYENRLQRHLDLAFTAMGCLLFLYFAFRSIQRNMTDDKYQLELSHDKLVEQRAVLDEVLSDKEKLISIIAHDLRAPLSSINGYFQLLHSGALEKEQKKEMDEQIFHMTNNSLTMLEELTEWASAKTTKMKLEKVSLSDLHQSVLNLLKPIAQVKGIHISSTLNQSNHSLYADMRMLQVILRNLATNAVKFTPKDGKIELFTSETEAGYLNIHIKDNGVGMKQNILEQLFKHHVPSSHGTNKESGNGLGLFICGEFITLLKGHIEVTSEPGTGAEFVIKLPCFVEEEKLEEHS